MANYVVESTFIHRGMKCCVVLNSMGFRCGYVGVTKPSKFWGLSYNDMYKLYRSPDVHGGLTYSSKKADDGYPIETCNETWWFGFDCGHFNDGYDWDSVAEQIPDMADSVKYFKSVDKYDNRPARSNEFVRNECIKLANWFSVNDEV